MAGYETPIRAALRRMLPLGLVLLAVLLTAQAAWAIRVKDVATNAKWKALSDPEMMLMHVIIPKVEEAPAPAEAAVAGAAAAPAEPEVIKKGKKEEETAEAAPAPTAGKKEKK